MKSRAAKKAAPKLPRFKCPKSLSSKTFKTKKDKARTRKSLNKLASEDSF